MNEILRDAYVDDNQRGVDRWNKVIREAGIDFELRLPSRRFNRKMGIHSGHCFDPEGKPITEAEFEAQREQWLPSEADKLYIKSLMQPVLEQGKIAQWIAPPARGINSQPFDFEYVRRV
jgi:benzoyl-CoA 2,3-dioxygenase component B